MLCAMPLSAQRLRLDPDTCWTCRDSREHFASGAALDVAAHLVLPRTKAWQRVVVVFALGAAYEAGQADIVRYTPYSGTRGFGFGLKDLALDVAGALVAEALWTSVKRALE